MLGIRFCLVAVSILVLTACSAGGDIPPPDPPSGLEPPKETAAPPPPPIAPSAPQPLPPVPAAAPAPKAAQQTPKTGRNVVPPAAGRTPNGPAPTSTAAPDGALPLDLKALKQQLKETKAIGFFSKIALKNQVDDLLEQFGAYYKGKSKMTMADLRQSYNLLMMKVLSLVQDGDQKLASIIVASREMIWGLLADQKKFATLEI